MPAWTTTGAAAAQMGNSIFSGIMGKSAAKKQEEAIRKAEIQQLEPWRTRGNEAAATLSDILAGKLNVDDMVQQSSLLKFQQETGSRDINRQLHARGLYGSEAGFETLAKFENQLLGEEGERYMGRLFQMSDSGRGAASGENVFTLLVVSFITVAWRHAHLLFRCPTSPS